MWCHYNAANFLLNTRKRHPIARPWGSFVSLISDWYSASMQCCRKYCVILDRIIMTPQCICKTSHLSETLFVELFCLQISYIILIKEMFSTYAWYWWQLHCKQWLGMIFFISRYPMNTYKCWLLIYVCIKILLVYHKRGLPSPSQCLESIESECANIFQVCFKTKNK